MGRRPVEEELRPAERIVEEANPLLRTGVLAEAGLRADNGAPEDFSRRPVGVGGIAYASNDRGRCHVDTLVAELK